MPNQRGLWCVLSVVTLLSTVAHATPWSLTDASIQMDATKALDTPISQLWSERNDLVAQMAQAGLVDPHTGHDHDHDNGMGGNFEPEIGALSSDSIEYTINELSEQAQRRQDSLDRLAESLTYRQSGDPVNISRLLAVEPVANARLTSSYGYRTMGGRGEFHPGVDLAAPYGTPIYSTGAGVVVYSGWMRGYGNFIEIDHGNGYKTRYGHSSRLLVSVGDDIRKDQQIAMVGCTGRCTGPHLHYEIVREGKRQDPSMYLALAPKRDE
jgi:murein DD-endopeptidase MepM/ murein hydrolase activator NlpD